MADRDPAPSSLAENSPGAAGAADPTDSLGRFPLLRALNERRSRRFAPGMELDGGPLAFASSKPPAPLSFEEEAALAFAACGVTGYALAELPYQPGRRPESGGGNIMTHFVGRTVASGDAMHDCTVFVLNDAGTWMLRRPQDYPRAEIPTLIEDARRGRLTDNYERARVKVSDTRADVPRGVPFVPPFNKWSGNVPGTTYFLPVAELSALYINVLLSMFDEGEFAFFAIDERNQLQPAGVAPFARSAGGFLNDDPRAGRVVTLGFLDTWVCEFVAIEQGAILQNLGLAAAALGLGGFPHFAAHPFIWPVCLGFRTEGVPLSRVLGLPRAAGGASQGDELDVPTPLGLERDGRVLIKPFCPPYYKNMREAVLAFVDYKYAAGRGTFRDGGGATGWRDGAAVQSQIPCYPDRAIDATIACSEYIYARYGRFPAIGPIRTVLAYQAHRLDPDFYRKFYRDEAWSFGTAG